MTHGTGSVQSGHGPHSDPQRRHPYLFYWLTAGGGAVIVATIGVVANIGFGSGAAPTTIPPSPEPSLSSFVGTVVVPPGYGTVGMHAAQWLNAPLTVHLGAGAKVRISRTVQGGLVTDNGHQSTLWNKIDGGYLPDVDVYTGTDQPARPNCTS